MKSLKLKVCGLRNNITEVDGLNPDYLGFIFWGPSSRFNNAQHLPQTKGKKVGVFVDASQETIGAKINQLGLDAVQLHGRESQDFCAEIKGLGVELFKAIRVEKGNLRLEQLRGFEPYVDYFLFDTAGKLPGGNGVRFDWSRLNNYALEKPFFLSGGIAPENQVEAIEYAQKHPFCVGLDVNSGFEIEPGLKNIDALIKLKSAIDENA
ncbi:phosphoribosylanthranilate isomerase [Luteibaculum oceani]|uniref:N-(5'-phosphoribosyl)anthranilate isomerase n=1 Tax=Luteibaculum oceani TaxID=1294296 RepID=A0A5C6UYK7_9FLAO|nr:phosphoribosylanthranilate isomerase [Luteibaculum oceani]TXC78563.1 phosphoribosylanthranilate isomerase [Luteibaculum oceani]